VYSIPPTGVETNKIIPFNLLDEKLERSRRFEKACSCGQRG